MADNRPEKRKMRDMWADCVGRTQQEGSEPLYLTLCGAQGLDIEALIEKGHLQRSETTAAISERDFSKVVAVESRHEAVVELARRFPGLKIVDQDFGNLVHSEKMTNWPTGSHRIFSRAKVVNLDLNSPLVADIENGQLVFQQLIWIEKLAHLHALDPPVEWTLCLTLSAQLQWAREIEQRVRALLSDNMASAEPFDDAAEELLGGTLAQGIRDKDDSLILSDLPVADQQHLLMALIPKKIAQDSSSAGWRIDTRRNLRYGGYEDVAAMVTWIFDFCWDERGSSEPVALYQEGAVAALKSPEKINLDGEIIALG